MPETQRKILQPITQTGQWLRALIPIGAAVATILASAHSCGLIGDQPTRLTVGTLGVHWIGVSPAADTATALGDTLRFVASVTDRRGAALVGAAIVWTSDDSAVAAVDSAGFVEARAPGVTHVVARLGDKAARARVVVRPRVARVQLTADGGWRVAEGGRRTIAVRAVDARGHALATGEAQAQWRSADTAIATVDANGAVAGRLAGRAAIVATIEGASDSAMVDVVPEAGAVAIARGDGQRADAGAKLAEPVVVRVLSRLGRPLAGAMVRFALAENGGAVRPDSAITGADGLASAAWTLGERPGRQRLIVQVAGADSVTGVGAEAEPLARNTRWVSLGDSVGDVGRPVNVGVRLTDSLGRVLAGVPVSWRVRDGGAVREPVARTDSLGEARAEWVLGPRAGVQRVGVLVGGGRNVPMFALAARAHPAAAARLTREGPADAEGVVGAALARGITVRAVDSAGNGVPGVELTAAPAAGRVAATTLTTDADGRATVRWTLGHAPGTQRLAVTARALSPLTVTALARVGAPANLAFVNAPEAGSTGRALPVRVSVTDTYGNAVAEQAVELHALAGTATPARLVTGKDGVASVRWTLGRQAGQQSLDATVPKTRVRARLTIDASVPRPTVRAAKTSRR